MDVWNVVPDLSSCEAIRVSFRRRMLDVYFLLMGLSLTPLPRSLDGSPSLLQGRQDDISFGFVSPLFEGSTQTGDHQPELRGQAPGLA